MTWEDKIKTTQNATCDIDNLGVFGEFWPRERPSATRSPELIKIDDHNGAEWICKIECLRPSCLSQKLA